MELHYTRVAEHRLDVELSSDCVLSFCNLVEEDDTLIGFEPRGPALALSWTHHVLDRKVDVR